MRSATSSPRSRSTPRPFSLSRRTAPSPSTAASEASSAPTTTSHRSGRAPNTGRPIALTAVFAAATYRGSYGSGGTGGVYLGGDGSNEGPYNYYYDVNAGSPVSSSVSGTEVSNPNVDLHRADAGSGPIRTVITLVLGDFPADRLHQQQRLAGQRRHRRQYQHHHAGAGRGHDDREYHRRRMAAEQLQGRGV